MAQEVPDDIVRLSRMTFRYRKLLWIIGVPALALQGFVAEKHPTAAIIGALLSVGICVLAASHRSPLRDPGIRQLVEHPEQVDQIGVVDNPGMAQIVFFRGDEGLSFLDIEDTSKFREALDIVSVHLPNVPVTHLETTLSRFEYSALPRDLWAHGVEIQLGRACSSLVTTLAAAGSSGRPTSERRAERRRR